MTPIGTPPNVIGLGLIRKQLGVEISFLRWCSIGVPVATVLTALMVLLLTRLFPAGCDRLHGVADLVARERATLGRWTTGQASTALAFAVTVALWVTPGLA
ncbi:MAG: anion permease, partial [Planctomycetaceae bacterium]